MEAVMAAPSTIGYTAILEAHEPADPGSVAPFRMRLCRGNGIHKAWTWIPPKPMEVERMRKVHVTEVDALADDFSWCRVVTNMVAAQNSPILPLILPSCSNATGLAERLRDVVATIEAIPLVDFINDVFTLSQVYRHFFTCPASQDYHHAFPGGLAVHSIEMAERVARTPFTPTDDRDLAVVYALFHDVGKILCYGKVGFTSSQELGHELAGVLLLKDPLDALEARWEDGATALTTLLAGLWKVKGGRPILALGKIVQAFDQDSVEQDRRKHKNLRHQPWTARPCNGNFGRARAPR